MEISDCWHTTSDQLLIQSGGEIPPIFFQRIFLSSPQIDLGFNHSSFTFWIALKGIAAVSVSLVNSSLLSRNRIKAGQIFWGGSVTGNAHPLRSCFLNERNHPRESQCGGNQENLLRCTSWIRSPKTYWANRTTRAWFYLNWPIDGMLDRSA